jgi:hypothetical protein
MLARLDLGTNGRKGQYSSARSRVTPPGAGPFDGYPNSCEWSRSNRELKCIAMPDESYFWRLDRDAKTESVARDIDPLIRRARAAGLPVTAYLLELAAQEARKELRSGFAIAR